MKLTYIYLHKYLEESCITTNLDNVTVSNYVCSFIHKYDNIKRKYYSMEILKL